MARELDGTYAGGLSAPVIMPIRLVMLTFASMVKYVWSGVGTLSWNGNDFGGVGSLGQVGTITEGVNVEANGTTVSLSGIDPTLLSECLTDIQIGAPARIWRGLWSNGALYGTPYQTFRGYVDKPVINISAETLAITLSLESRIVNLGRASYRRYTAADQHLQYPNDCGFDWIEEIQDIALKTGT